MAKKRETIFAMGALALFLFLPITASAQSQQVTSRPQPVLSAITLPASSTIKINFEGERTADQFPRYLESLKQFARDNGIHEETIQTAFANTYFIERVVKADKSQPEKKISFKQYLANVVSSTRIATAREKYREYHQALQAAAEITGVPAQYIVALWGIESGFGRNQGKEDIISAVSTLAFDGRREAFFARELLASLHILQEGHIEKEKFKGSWAGAMGQNQFMPSSYLAFAVDGDGDGIADIWNNPNDIFASTGNYLATVGWNKNERWGNPVYVPNDLNLEMMGLDNSKAKTVAEWQALGVKWRDKTQTHLSTATKAWLIYADPDDNTSGYLVSNNFRTIMHWNRSYYFAVSVGTLADAVIAPTSSHTSSNK